MTWRAVTDKQWKLIAAQLPERLPNPKGGRPPTSDRQCFEGILWILWTGASWSELPPRYGSKRDDVKQLALDVAANCLLGTAPRVPSIAA